MVGNLRADSLCRLCGCPELTCVLTVEKSPRCISKLLAAEALQSDVAIALDVAKCGGCGFVQSLPVDAESSYDDYVMSWMHLKTMETYRRTLCADYVNQYKMQGRKILDVGCGSGEFMEMLQECDVVACGVEPSSTLCERASKKGFQVVRGLVSDESLSQLRGLGGFTCLQVLEHVSDPVAFLRVLRGCLANDGVAIVEVPALERIIEDRRLYEFFPDHLNYFSLGTLTRACESAGFQVLQAVRGFDHQFLTVFISPAEFEGVAVYGELREPLEEACDWVLARSGEGFRVAAWGAGYKSTAAIAELGMSCIECVVDSDVSKHGLYMPVSHLPVVSPAEIAARSIGAILITAIAYKREIFDFLQRELRFAGPVAALGRRLEILQD